MPEQKTAIEGRKALSITRNIAGAPAPNIARLTASGDTPEQATAAVAASFAFVFGSDRRLLLVADGDGWDLPGGARTVADTATAVCRKAIAEVAEVTVDDLDLAGNLSTRTLSSAARAGRGRDTYTLYYLAEVDDVTADDARVRWCDAATVADLAGERLWFPLYQHLVA